MASERHARAHGGRVAAKAAAGGKPATVKGKRGRPPAKATLERKARAVSADRRQAQAHELRLYGHTLRQIAERVGFANEGQALAAIAREARRQEAVTALQLDDERRLDLARADLLLTGIMDRAVKGDADAQKRALDLLRYRADLLGLCAPVKANIKTELTGPGGGPVQLAAVVVPGVASIEQWRASAAAHLARPAELASAEP